MHRFYCEKLFNLHPFYCFVSFQWNFILFWIPNGTEHGKIADGHTNQFWVAENIYRNISWLAATKCSTKGLYTHVKHFSMSQFALDREFVIDTWYSATSTNAKNNTLQSFLIFARQKILSDYWIASWKMTKKQAITKKQKMHTELC